MFRMFATAIIFALTGCATAQDPDAYYTPVVSEGTPIGFGEWVWLNEPYTSIGPQELIEDSRCPPNARCMWEGEVRIAAVIAHDPEPDVIYHHDNSLSARLEFGTAKGTTLFGGDITVERIEPLPAETGTTIDPKDYRFVFRIAPN